MLIVARRGSLGGVEHRVRHDRPSVECASLARVGMPSRHPSVRRVRRPPSIANSAPSLRTLTMPPGCAVPDTGAGPQALLHCCTVNASLTAVMFQGPSRAGGRVVARLASRGSAATRARRRRQRAGCRAPGASRSGETSRGDLAGAKAAVRGARSARHRDAGAIGASRRISFDWAVDRALVVLCRERYGPKSGAKRVLHDECGRDPNDGSWIGAGAGLRGRARDLGRRRTRRARRTRRTPSRPRTATAWTRTSFVQRWTRRGSSPSTAPTSSAPRTSAAASFSTTRTSSCGPRSPSQAS